MTMEDIKVLAYVPDSMRSHMGELKSTALQEVTICDRPEQLADLAKKPTYSVALLPADLSMHRWLSTWGLIMTLDPRPSILVYALESDFSMWSGLLETGAFDVIVAPFTGAKLADAIECAARDYRARLAES